MAMKYIIYTSILLGLYSLHLLRNPLAEDKTRSNITFILGEDSEYENQYYAAAKKYYLTHDIDNQSVVIDTCRSVWSILQYLETQPTIQNKPWGRVNIIVHGNEWTGLKLTILPNGKERTKTETLTNALENNSLGEFKTIKKLDSRTQIHIKGCAVGKDKALLSAFKKVFGGRVQVFSPEKFVLYQPDNKCYLADYYYSFHHPDSSFVVENAVQYLTNRYENVLNWQTILTETNPRKPQNPFIYRFKIPIRWTVNFQDSTEIPQFSAENGQNFENWLYQQNDLMTHLEKVKLPKEAFRWVHETEENHLKIYGVCQVVCILKPQKVVQ